MAMDRGVGQIPRAELLARRRRPGTKLRFSSRTEISLREMVAWKQKQEEAVGAII